MTSVGKTTWGGDERSPVKNDNNNIIPENRMRDLLIRRETNFKPFRLIFKAKNKRRKRDRSVDFMWTNERKKGSLLKTLIVFGRKKSYIFFLSDSYEIDSTNRYRASLRPINWQTAKITAAAVRRRRDTLSDVDWQSTETTRGQGRGAGGGGNERRSVRNDNDNNNIIPGERMRDLLTGRARRRRTFTQLSPRSHRQRAQREEKKIKTRRGEPERTSRSARRTTLLAKSRPLPPLPLRAERFVLRANHRRNNIIVFHLFYHS